MSIVACRSSPTTTRTRGAPCRPWAATSQPAPASTRCRADGERGEVGHHPAGDEPDGRRGRETEQVEEPPARDLLDHGRGGRGRVQTGVVVPTARQPVGRERGGVAAADDEPEVARTGDAQQPGCRPRRELGDHGLVGGRGLRGGAAEHGAELLQRRRRVHGTGLELGALLRHELAHPCQQVSELTAGRSHVAPPPSFGVGYVARRCFSSKIASIGPGSTSLSSAR